MAVATFNAANPVPRASAPARRRRVIGGGLALATSLCAHALMAAIAGVTLYSLGARERPPATGVEIEIAAAPAPILLDTPVPAPPAADPPPAPQKPARRTEAVRRVVAARPSAAALPSSPVQPVADSAPAVAEAPAPAPARFAMSAGTVAGRAGEPGPASPALPASSLEPSTATPTAGGAGADPVLDASAVDEPAALLSHPPAPYPPAARRAEIEGDVAVEIVVGADGVVSRASVLSDRGHGYGLDAAALQAVRAYRFSPARRAGHPVRVRMRWTVQFRLR